MDKHNLCGLTADEIFDIIKPLGYFKAHAVSITNSIYKKRISEVSKLIRLPKKLMNELEERTSIEILKPVNSEVSLDKTVKYLFRTNDGREFESVYIRDNKRSTICLSTQSGCRMGCTFCVTSGYGFHGNLSCSEIVNQVLSLPVSYSVSHIVFMGMGEPMDNLNNVLKACKILTAEWGHAISPRNITVSTVGITPKVKEFLYNSECNLTLSLHSPFSEERKRFVPAENKFASNEIIELMKNFEIKKKRRFSIAYVMIKDLNDTDYHLEGLKTLLGGSKIRINLLAYHRKRDDFNNPSSPERMQFFKHNLVESGISASVRKSRGIDISAACGLLAAGLKR